MIPESEMTVDDLAQEIRRVDGSNSLGAGALAEALMPFLASRLTRQDDEIRKAALEEAAKVAELYRAEFERALPHYGPADKDAGRGRQEGHIHAAENIAAAIRFRALSQKGDEADG